MKHKRGWTGWARGLAAECAISITASALTALLRGAGQLAYWTAAYGGMPVAGAVAAYCSVRLGVNAYAAFPVPAAAFFAVHWAVWYAPPDPGPVLVCLLVSLIGSAAGDVKNRRGRRNEA